ncbi:MAG: polyprenyl synthetase family protein [Burkholderiales bacterium]|nr:polyprenyl synthetase family protein [Burkholderiales bacterium]
MQNDFQRWTADKQQRIETLLDSILPPVEIAPQRLHGAMRYAVLGRGKRIRPLLAFAAGELAQADVERVAIAAAVTELVHAYSLVHDDLPCMDDDVLRRGKPTCHVEYDEATALLCGDALQSLAFQLIADYRLADEPAAQLEMVKLLAIATGSRGMAGGQAIDLESIGKNLSLLEVEAMHIHKTGALIRAAVLFGARCGNSLDDEQFGQLDRYAQCMGLAFQVVDDLLDAESTTATLGKTAGKDAGNNKPTYVSLLGLSATRDLALSLRGDALDALGSFGAQATRLREIADYIVLRKF